MANSIKFDVGFNVNQSDLNGLISSLRKVQTDMQKATSAGTITTELKQAGEAAKQLEGILNQAWNSKLGQLDLSKVNSSIKSAYGNVNNLKSAMEKSGAAGAAAYNKFASSILNTNVQIKQSSKLLDQMATTFKNTVRYGISSSIFNNLVGSLEKAWSYSIKLDNSLNDIRIVTDKSAEDMERFAQSANKASKQMGASTLDYTNAALIYYQQGLSDAEVAARAETTLKAANVTGQRGEEVSEQLTAVWNGYKVTAEETETYVDKLAAVAATTASDLEELSVGMSKVASAANAMGVDFDDLNAQIATIVSVTRQAPESVGTALKTIYARLGDLQVDGVDEFGVSLGKVGEQMAQMGIQILDQQGNLRDMSSIIAEVAEKWDGWTQAQRQAAAVAMAGKRQYNNLIALFDNWDMYTDALNTSVEAVGTLQHQQDIYMESTEAHLQKLKTEAENTYDILFDTDSVNTMSDAMTGLLHIFNNFISGVGGGISALTSLGAIATRVFSQQIGAGLGNMVLNMQKAKDNADMLILKQQVIDAHAAQGDHVGAKAAEAEAEIMQKTLAVAKGLTDEEYNQLMTYQKEIGLLTERLDYLSGYEQVYNKLYGEGKANAAVLEAEAAEQQNITNGIKEQIQYFGQLQKEHSKIVFEDEARIALQTRLSALQVSDVITEEQKEALKKASNDIEKTSGLTQENIKNILVIQNQLLEQQVQYENKIKQAAEGARAAESGETQEIQNQINATRNLVDAEHEVANTRMKMADAVTALSTITMMITSLSGIVKTLGDDSLTTGEKLERVFTTLLFALPMVLTSIGPIVSTMSNLAIALAGEAGAAAAAAGVNFTLGESFTIVAAAVGTFLVKAWPFIAIGAALAAAGIAIYNAWTKDAKAAEQAAETAKALGEAYEETKQRVEELANAFDGYTSAIETLEQCTRGTQEWNDALVSVNDSVAEILSKFPELLNQQGLFEHTAEGIRINTDLMQEAIDKANQATTNAQVASVQGQVEAKKAQIQADVTDLSHNTYMDLVSVGNDAINKAVDAISENSTLLELGASELAKNANITEEEASSLLNHKAALESLANATKEAQVAEENAALLAISKVEEFADADTATIQLAKGKYQQQYDELYNEWLDNTQNKIARWSEASDKAVSDLWKEYNNAIDKNLKLVSNDAVKGSGKDREFFYKDEEGKKQSVTADEIAQTIAAAKALENLGNSADKIANVLSEVGKNAGMAATGIKGWIGSKDLGSMTNTQVSNLKKDIGDTSDLVAVQTYLEKVFGGAEKLADVAQQMNFDSVEDMAEAFQTSVEGYDEAIQKVKDEVAKFGLKDIFKDFDTSSLTLDGQRALANTLERAISLGGDTAAADIKKIYDAVPKDKIQDFSDSLDDIDWNSITESELKDYLKDTGVNANNLDIDLKDLINRMQENGDATENLATKYTEINKITKGLEQGDTISAEDYEKLGEVASGYFTQMLDGTYKLTGAASDFQRAIQENIIDQVKQTNSQLSTNNVNLNRVSNFDFDSLAVSQNQEEDGKNAYNRKSVQEQIALIEVLGDKSEETAKKIQQWKTDLSDGSTQKQTLQDIANAVENCRQAYENIDEQIKTNTETIEQNKVALALTANSMHDLNNMFEEGVISQNAFNIASENMHLEERLEDLDIEEIEDYADYLQELAESEEEVYLGGEKLSKDLADNEDAAEDIAIQIQRMNKGVEDLADNWKDWSDILKKSSKGSEEYLKAMRNTKDAMADLLDLSSDYISSDFVDTLANDTKAMELMKKAAKGDADAIDSLRQMALQDIILNLELNDSDLSNEEIWTKVQGLQSMLDAMGPITAGTEIDLSGMDAGEADFINALNELILAAGMSKDQVNQMLSGMGFTANYSSEPQEVMKREPDQVHTKRTISNMTTRELDDGSQVTEYEMDDVVTTTPGKLVKGTVDTPSLETTEPGTTVVPKINSVTKKAPSSANNYSASNKGGKSPGKSSGGKKGGGKGKGKGKEKNKKDKPKNERDRYYEINNTLNTLSSTLDKIDKQKEHLAGNALAKKLTQENKVINEQIKAYRVLAKIQDKESDAIQKRLKKQGAKFDKNGNFVNYSKIYNQELKRYQDAVEKFNKSKQTKKDEKELEKAEKRYKKFVEDTERNASLQEERRQTAADKEAARLQKIANNYEKWDVKLNVKLDKKEFKRDWLEFVQEINDDFKLEFPDITVRQKNHRKIANTYAGKGGTLDLDEQKIADIEAELKKLEAGKKSKMFATKSEAKEALKEAKKVYMEDVKAFNELRQEVWNDLIDGIEQAADRFDLLQESFEELNDELSYQKELIELIYGPEAYDLMDSYYKAQEQASLNQINSLKQQADMWEQQFKNSGADKKDRLEWTKEEVTYYENWKNAEEEMKDNVLEHIKLIKEDYLNAVDNTLLTLEKELNGGKTFEEVEKEWDRISKDADKYYDSVEKAYEIQSLANKMDKEIASTKDLKNQQKLQKIRDEEIAILKEKDKLTEYDVKKAQAKYDIALKEIALENSRNNKNSMKLTRNAQGNWSYQYVADTSDLESKQQDVLDSIHNLYELASDGYTKNLQELQDLKKEYHKTFKEISQDESLTIQERNKKIEELNEQFYTQQKILIKENSMYREDLTKASAGVVWKVYEKDKKNYEFMTTEEKKLIDALIDPNNGSIPKDYNALEISVSTNLNNIKILSEENMKKTREDWSSSTQQMADYWNGDGGFSVRTSVTKAFNAIINASVGFNTSLQTLQSTSGQLFSKDGITGGLEKASSAAEQLNTDTTNMVTNLVGNDGKSGQLGKLKDGVKQIELAWAAVNAEMSKYLAEEIKIDPGNILKTGAGSATTKEIAIDEKGHTVGFNNDGTLTVNGMKMSADQTPLLNNKERALKAALAYKEYGPKESGWGEGDTLKKRLGSYKIDYISFMEYANKSIDFFRPYLLRMNPSDYKYGKSFDTGGYTGSWGEEGRLALLHQKELVLNKEDTKNFLEGINTIRDMSALNGSISNSIAKAIANMMVTLSKQKLGNFDSGTEKENTSNVFNITAEFPNAENVNEIREAILSLPNIASQYAAKNKM